MRLRGLRATVRGHTRSRCFGDGAGYLSAPYRQRGDRFISESKALQFYNSARKACLLACRCRTKTLKV